MYFFRGMILAWAIHNPRWKETVIGSSFSKIFYNILVLVREKKCPDVRKRGLLILLSQSLLLRTTMTVGHISNCYNYDWTL